MRKFFALSMLTMLTACAVDEQPPPRDASAVVACRDFTRAYIDVRDGVINVQELRMRLVKVHEYARLSDDPRIVEESRASLAAITSNTPNYDSVAKFAKLCEELD